MELELEMGGSAGMVSRIEKGKVNPSKETIKSIAEVLNLNPNELDYLTGLTAIPATEKEIEDVINKVKYYLNKTSVIAYITDERWRILSVSKGFVMLLHSSQEVADGICGKTIIEVLLDEKLGIKQFFDPKAYEEILKIQLAYCKREMAFMEDDKYFSKGLELMKKFPEVWEYWKGLETSNLGVFYCKDERIIPFKVGPMVFKMIYARERLLDNPRFEIVEYLPVNKSLRVVQKLLKGDL
jgi:transcriptional regulator with XRE-family HTH domain